MISLELSKLLHKAFPRAMINMNFEFIVDGKNGGWFRLEDCYCMIDVECKVLEYLSREAYKSIPYTSNNQNKRYREYVLKGINTFLGSNFDEDEIEFVYSYCGNGCNHERTRRFIDEGCNISQLEEWVGDKVRRFGE